MRIGTRSAAPALSVLAATTAASRATAKPPLLVQLSIRFIQLIAALPFSIVRATKENDGGLLPPSLPSFQFAREWHIPSKPSCSMAAELLDGPLIAMLLPALVARIVDHGTEEVVRIHDPARLRPHRDIGGDDRLLIGDLIAQRRADRRRVGLVDRDIDLRPDVLIVEDRIAHAVRVHAEADDRAELDIRRRQRVHDLEEMRAHRRGRQAGVGADAFLQQPAGVVPDEGEVVIAAQDELIEDADRAAGAARNAAEAGRPQILLSWHRRIAGGEAGLGGIEARFAGV